MRKLCAISVDLDSIECYYRIHALGEPPAALRDIILHRALPRFAALCQRRGIPLTLFVVGRDIDPAGSDAGPAAAQAARAQLGSLVKQGHELGNHSYSHPYELARLPEATVRSEIQRAHALLTEVAGKAPVGFRAPGYDLSAVMLDELEALGYLYDSSIFPAPGYYTLKLGVMAAMRLLGRKSGAVLTSPWALLAPTDAYRPSSRAPWRRGQSSLVELPIGVTPWLRVPAFGTSLVVLPDRLRATLLEHMRARPVFNLECHGIDLIDADSDGIPGGLVAKQPDLKVPLTHKLRSLEATLDRLAPEYDFVTLREVARGVQRGTVPGGLSAGMTSRVRLLERLHRDRKIVTGSYLGAWLSAAFRRPRMPEPRPLATVEPGELAVALGGHATVLMRYASGSLVTDPVLSRWAGGVKRAIEPGLGIGDIAAVDLVLISHAHGDHLDLGTLRQISPAATLIVPPGLAPEVRRLGFRKIVPLGHGQRHEQAGLRVTAEPVRHPSRSGASCYFIEGDGPSALFVGDSGYFSGFAELGARHAPDLALLPIAGYAPRSFRANHLSPLDALFAWEDLGAAALVPIHHGVFALSCEALDDPATWLAQLVRERGLEDAVRAVPVGASLVFTRPPAAPVQPEPSSADPDDPEIDVPIE